MRKSSKIWTSIFVSLMTAFLTMPINFNLSPDAVLQKLPQLINKIGFSFFSIQNILAEEIPLLGAINGKQDMNLGPRTKLAVATAFGAITDVQAGRPASLLQAEIPILALVPEKTPEKVAAIPIQEQFIPEVPQGEPLVGIYNTHTGETYELTDGTDRLEGKRGGVVKAAASLEKALKEKHGIMTVRSDTIHDEKFTQSYSKSEETAMQMLKDYPALKVIIDVHRDEVARERTVVNINGEEVAKVILVVGTDATLEHPNWKKNYAFAQQIIDTMNKMYPGLARGSGLLVKNGRYHQQLHDHAILIEIGSDKNSTPEAERSAQLMADVIAEVMKM